VFRIPVSARTLCFVGISSILSPIIPPNSIVVLDDPFILAPSRGRALNRGQRIGFRFIRADEEVSVHQEGINR